MALLVLKDPLTFIFFYFLKGVAGVSIASLLLLSLMTTVVSYPFIYIGERIRGKILKDEIKWKRDLATSIIISFLFWTLFRVWYVLMGSMFTTDFLGFLTWIVISGFIFYLLYLTGEKIHSKITDLWEMPLPISILITSYAVNLLAWIVLYIVMIINVGGV